MPKAYVIVYRGNGDDKPYEVLLGQKQVINYRCIKKLALAKPPDTFKIYADKIKKRMWDEWTDLVKKNIEKVLSVSLNSGENKECLVCACNPIQDRVEENKKENPDMRLKGILSPAGGLPCFFGGRSEDFNRDHLKNEAIRELVEELRLNEKLGLDGKEDEIEALKADLLAHLDKDNNTPSQIKAFVSPKSKGKATYYLLNIKNTPLEHIYSDTQNGIGGNIDLNTIKSIYNSPGDAHPETNGTYEIYQATWRSISSLNREWARGYQDYVDFIKAETEKFSEFLLSIFNIPTTTENMERLSENLINHLMTHEKVDWNVEAAEYAQYEIANIQSSEQSPLPAQAGRQHAPA